MPLVLDGTTGFSLPLGAEIGVGTDTPGGNGLHVDHTAGATLRLTRLGTSTSHFVQLETDGAHGTLRSEGNLTLQSGGANPRITVLSTGNVGIGASNNSSYDSNAQNLLLASSGNTGMTIRSAGSTPFAMIHFADGTADNNAKRAGRIIYQHDGDNLTIHTANTERVRFDGSGNVGINTTTSSYKLQVNHGTTAEYASSIRNTADNLQLLLGTTTGGLLNIQGKTISSNAAYQIALQAEGGNVGIGTASPAQNLTVYNATASNFEVRSSNKFVGLNASSGYRPELWWQQGQDLGFGTATNGAGSGYDNKMLISSAGNVGIGTTGPVSSGYDTGSTKLTVMSTTLNNATSGYLELASRANTNGYNAGAIQFNNFENAGTSGSGTQNRTVGQIRTVITTTDSNAGDDSGGTMQFWTKPEAQALANTMTISTQDPNHRADVTVDATGLAGDGGTNANAFFNAKAKGNYYAGTRIHSNSGHVGGWIGHWNGSSTARELQARVGGNGLNSSDYLAIRSDYLGRVTHPNRPHFRVRGFPSHRYVNVIQGGEDGRLRDWNTVDLNRGGHFTNSTGKFTIPITGDYAFYCTLMYTNPNTQDFHLTFKLNGGTLTASNDHNAGGGGQGHQWNGTTLCYSGYFSANDYVGYSITGGGNTSTTYLYQSNTYNVMGGYLL